MNLESARFLPGDISAIVEKLIDIRIETFENAVERRNEDYLPWPNPSKEHPTQFYPNWNIFRYPKKYEVRAKRDQDFCDKAFDGANDFAYGIFSVDCSCKANINYGYELMLTRESAHNLFR